MWNTSREYTCQINIENMLPCIIYLGYVKFLYPLCLVTIGDMLCCKSHLDLEYFHFFLGGST